MTSQFGPYEKNNNDSIWKNINIGQKKSYPRYLRGPPCQLIGKRKTMFMFAYAFFFMLRYSQREDLIALSSRASAKHVPLRRMLLPLMIRSKAGSQRGNYSWNPLCALPLDGMDIHVPRRQPGAQSRTPDQPHMHRHRHASASPHPLDVDLVDQIEVCIVCTERLICT